MNYYKIVNSIGPKEVRISLFQRVVACCNPIWNKRQEKTKEILKKIGETLIPEIELEKDYTMQE